MGEAIQELKRLAEAAPSSAMDTALFQTMATPSTILALIEVCEAAEAMATAATEGPYSGAHGAVSHKQFAGFIFTTGPHAKAEDVAEGLNLREGFRRLRAALEGVKP